MTKNVLDLKAVFLATLKVIKTMSSYSSYGSGESKDSANNFPSYSLLSREQLHFVSSEMYILPQSAFNQISLAKSNNVMAESPKKITFKGHID